MTAQARASHILVKTEDEATRIMKRLNDGEDFAAVAKRFSGCPSGKSGGDLGWFGKGMMVPEFEKAAFENDVGKLIGPIKTQFGWHVIKVTGKK
ncbi:MAG: peptidylprolyl isomerase [Methanoregula sp.]|jgi:peptidyl-prolyl cis-trans isomerase C